MNLEVEDASVVVLKALVGRDDVRQHLLVEGQRRDGGQEPAVAWTHTGNKLEMALTVRTYCVLTYYVERPGT